MKRIYVMAAAVPALALFAAAQDAPRKTVLRQDIDDTMQSKLKAELDAAMGQMKIVSLSGAAMGPTVKGGALFGRGSLGEQPGACGWHPYPQ